MKKFSMVLFLKNGSIFRVKNYRRCIAVFFIFLAMTAQAENLSEIYMQALANDPTLAAAQRRWDAAQEKVPQARAAFLPNVSASAEGNLNDGKKTENSYTGYRVDNDGQYKSYGYNVSVTQSIYKRQNNVIYSQAEEQIFLASDVLRQAQQELILKTATAYFDILSAETEVELTEKQRQAVFEQLDQAEHQFSAGLVAITDANEAKAQYDTITASDIAAKNKYLSAQVALQAITGKMPAPLAKVKKTFSPVAPRPNIVSYWTERAMNEYPKVRIAEASARLASLDIEKAKAGHYPTLDVVGSWRQNNGTGAIDNPYDYQSRNAQIGLQLNIPLYQGGYVSSVTREAIASREAARQELEAARRDAAYNAQTSFNEVNSAIAAIQAYQQAVRSSEVALESGKMGYEVGTRTNLDVLNIQKTLYTNLQLLAQAYFKYYISILRLSFSVGGLSEADVLLINQNLEMR